MNQKSEEKKSPEFVLFDAKGKILGRLATEIAKTLSGKDKVDFEPRLGGSCWVGVINSDEVKMSGEKANKKIYWRHSGFPGGIYKATFKEMMEKDSTLVIKKAVKGMMPKNKLSVEAMKRFRVFKDAEHPYKDKLVK